MSCRNHYTNHDQPTPPPTRWGTVLNTKLVVVIAPGKRPASIPNLEAKPGSANGTATARLWESRTPPQHTSNRRASSTRMRPFAHYLLTGRLRGARLTQLIVSQRWRIRLRFISACVHEMKNHTSRTNVAHITALRVRCYSHGHFSTSARASPTRSQRRGSRSAHGGARSPCSSVPGCSPTRPDAAVVWRQRLSRQEVNG